MPQNEKVVPLRPHVMSRSFWTARQLALSLPSTASRIDILLDQGRQRLVERERRGFFA